MTLISYLYYIASYLPFKANSISLVTPQISTLFLIRLFSFQIGKSRLDRRLFPYIYPIGFVFSLSHSNAFPSNLGESFS